MDLHHRSPKASSLQPDAIAALPHTHFRGDWRDSNSHSPGRGAVTQPPQLPHRGDRTGIEPSLVGSQPTVLAGIRLSPCLGERVSTRSLSSHRSAGTYEAPVSLTQGAGYQIRTGPICLEGSHATANTKPAGGRLMTGCVTFPRTSASLYLGRLICHKSG